MRKKNVWRYILRVTYDGGIAGKRENTIAEAARKYGGKNVGSGCQLFGSYTRDTDLAFHDKGNRTRAKGFLLASSMGFRFEETDCA